MTLSQALEAWKTDRDPGRIDLLVGLILQADSKMSQVLTEILNDTSLPSIMRVAAIDQLFHKNGLSTEEAISLAAELDRLHEDDEIVGAVYENIAALPPKAEEAFHSARPNRPGIDTQPRSSGVVRTSGQFQAATEEKQPDELWRSLAKRSSSRHARWLASLGE
jgi:hypothetical protein